MSYTKELTVEVTDGSIMHDIWTRYLGFTTTRLGPKVRIRLRADDYSSTTVNLTPDEARTLLVALTTAINTAENWR